MLVVHVGPGGGGRRGARRSFDPDAFRIVLFDQRGCGQSLPHSSDPSVDMAHNTTEHLLADMELLRGDLGIDRWLLYGRSWGSTLILAYAQTPPRPWDLASRYGLRLYSTDAWLSRRSEEWVRSADPGELAAQVMHDRWLGFAPATSDAVAAAEAR